jgi:hypothetical protein
MFNPQHKPRGYRLLEIIPGALVWTTFITAIALSLIRPLWGIYFILAYWILRILYLLIYLNVSWKKYRDSLKVNWHDILQREFTHSAEYYHVIFLPTFKEPLDVLEGTFDALKNSVYDTKKFIVLLGGEDRDEEAFNTMGQYLQNKYNTFFYDIRLSVHTKGLPGEMVGKGSNSHYMATLFETYRKKQNIQEEKIIVSNFDSDTQVHPQYFAYLTYTYLSQEFPEKHSYQPIAVFNNNIWESPALTRIVYNSTTFWLFTDLARPERLFTFSSHSMSYVTLKKVRYWQPDIVTEDSRICLQAMSAYHGDYSVIPLYIPVSMDTAYIGTFFPTLISQYKQQMRWAYGVENFPYIVWHFWSDSAMPFGRKMRHLWNQLEGVYSWATAPVLIFIMGYLPLALLNSKDQIGVLAQTAPIALQYLMWTGMVGLIFSASLSSFLMPERPHDKSWWWYGAIVFQWVLFPISMLLFGSIPATDAQTRLMLGRYIGFRVTEKKR